jgi:membrane fusion protein, multidrug efflux system
MSTTRNNQQDYNAERNRRMRKMLFYLAILFGCIIIYKVFIHFLIQHKIATTSHVISVSSMKVGESAWQPEIKAVGSTRALKGVNVTTQLAGMVQNIYFTPGAIVRKGVVLVQLNIDPDVAQLHALEATEDIDLITYNRDKKQYEAKGISKEQLDTDLANLKNMQAQVAEQAANIAKKIIQAPFDGRLGVSQVNPGQYLNPGDKIVTLQQLDPIWVDFYVPQQQISDLTLCQPVNVTIDAFPGKVFTGTITTIDPLIVSDTRNIEVEATVNNPKLELLPGMFTDVTINTSAAKKYITVPQTAITYNPYGNLVFLVVSSTDKDGKKTLIAKQNFVVTGETRGEQVAILKGLKEGDEVITSGQLKIKNGDMIAINNSIVPSDNPNPELPNEH